jgi:uncharacterized membrane protein (GlpM family)
MEYFGRCYSHLEYFTAIWYIFGHMAYFLSFIICIFCQLVHVFFLVLVYCTKKNLSTQVFNANIITLLLNT